MLVVGCEIGVEFVVGELFYFGFVDDIVLLDICVFVYYNRGDDFVVMIIE